MASRQTTSELCYEFLNTIPENQIGKVLSKWPLDHQYILVPKFGTIHSGSFICQSLYLIPLTY